MATEKVMITISGLQDHEVILTSGTQPDKPQHQVDLFQAADNSLESPVCSEAQPSSTPAKTLPDAAEAVTEGENPWEMASGPPTAINFRPDISLHAKMEWVCENMPRMSRLRILREGATLLCNQLIAKHYRSQD